MFTINEVKRSESRSVVSDSLQPTPGTIACQVPLSLGFARQEYWSGLPCPSPGDLPNPGIKPRSPVLQEVSLLSKPLGKSFTINAAAAVKSL